MIGRRASLGLAIAAVAAGIVAAAPAVGDGVDQARIAELVAKLAVDDATARDAAADALAEIGAPAVPALVAVVQDAASPARREATQVLGVIGGDAAPALGPLTALVADAKAKAQIEAATALGRIAVGAAKTTDPKFVPPGPAEKSMEAGLDWLARHQDADGHWSCAKFSAKCAKNDVCKGAGEAPFDVGVTGLALMAFLSAGETHAKGAHAANVTAGLKWLRGLQDAEGCFGPRADPHYIYNHACASLAVAEDWKRSGARALAEPVRRAVAFIHAARNPALAWRYSVPPDGTNDTSVTLWMAKVLDTAGAAGAVIDPVDPNGAASWVDQMTDAKTGRTGYVQAGGPTARTMEMMKRFPPAESESITAAAMTIRLAVGHTREDDPFLAMGEALLVKKPPVWDEPRGTMDLYYWLHGAEAMHRLGGPGWDVWRKGLTTALTMHQRLSTTGCMRGSWDPNDPWCDYGGRIWMTSAAVLSLSHAADDPARRQQMPANVRSAKWALEKVMKSTDWNVRRAAERALTAMAGAYR